MEHRPKAGLPWPIYLTVAGDSMVPALAAGDWILAVRTQRAQAGDVVVLTHPGRPGLLVVKRVGRVGPAGFWVLGDNPTASTDSRDFGPVARIMGRVIWRVRPWGPVR